MQQAITYFQIIKKCKQSNKLAQKLLYQKYSPCMQGICFRYISDPLMVKKIVQLAFIKIFFNIKQYTGHVAFEDWLKSFFINQVIEYLLKNHNKVSQLNTMGKHFSNNENPGLNENKLIEIANLSEFELLTVLDKLPLKHRMVFNLYCIEHYKHEQIASLLYIDVPTSEYFLNQALNIMRDEMYKIGTRITLN
jgi:RNA polymerase sigma-70 factor, ECF subfamily